ncbi:MAG: beta-hydroxyacyl-ACP dehydratase [Nitrospira sp.]|nr:beta-hydroxyacyl-ACP dehydratase [Nitrospira sp.]
MKHERVVSIGPDHPALPGHFPGHPVVPGVVILDEVIETLRLQAGQALVVTGLPSVKLSSPLLPGQPLTIEIEQDEADTAVFTCRVDQRVVAAGSIRIQLPAAGQARMP